MFTGAPEIDYHQVELPLCGPQTAAVRDEPRQTDARVTAAKALKDAAEVLLAGDPDTDERFVRAALMLDAAAAGRTTVAALRGERNSAPSFGSLADDLVDSPDAVSTPVVPVVVDRTPAPSRRLRPAREVRPRRTAVPDPGPADPDDRQGPGPGRPADRSPVGRSLQAQLAGRHRVPAARASGRPAVGRTLAPVGVSPLTRLASGTVGAVANSRPSPAAATRLGGMSASLVVGAGGHGAGPKSGRRGRRPRASPRVARSSTTASWPS